MKFLNMPLILWIEFTPKVVPEAHAIIFVAIEAVKFVSSQGCRSVSQQNQATSY